MKQERGSQQPLACAITVSDRSSDGTREDSGGRLLIEALGQAGYAVTGPVVVPDGIDTVGTALGDAVTQRHQLVVTTGGTGVGPRDLTPEATATVLTREMPGLAELLRREGSKQTPYAAVSRGLVGVADWSPDWSSGQGHGGTLIINLPGRPSAVEEGCEVILPLLSHVLSQLAGGDH